MHPYTYRVGDVAYCALRKNDALPVSRPPNTSLVGQVLRSLGVAHGGLGKFRVLCLWLVRL